MNALVQLHGGRAVTTTLAIADGTGNTHESVIKLVRRYEADLQEFGTFGFEIQKSGGRPTEYALLNEHQATLILTMMRNSPVVLEFKKKLVRAFYQMADRLVRPEVPQTLPEALRLAAELAEQAQQQREQIASLAPKACALDRISCADGSLCITDTAKALQIRPRDLFSWLSAHHWIYRRPGGSGWLGYQDKVQQGLLEHKVTTVGLADGSERTTEQVRVTGKGLTRLAVLLESAAA